MCKLRPLLKEWLEEAEAMIENGATVVDILEAPSINCLQEQQQEFHQKQNNSLEDTQVRKLHKNNLNFAPFNLFKFFYNNSNFIRTNNFYSTSTANNNTFNNLFHIISDSLLKFNFIKKMILIENENKNIFKNFINQIEKFDWIDHMAENEINTELMEVSSKFTTRIKKHNNIEKRCCLEILSLKSDLNTSFKKCLFNELKVCSKSYFKSYFKKFLKRFKISTKKQFVNSNEINLMDSVSNYALSVLQNQKHPINKTHWRNNSTKNITKIFNLSKNNNIIDDFVDYKLISNMANSFLINKQYPILIIDEEDEDYFQNPTVLDDPFVAHWNNCGWNCQERPSIVDMGYDNFSKSFWNQDFWNNNKYNAGTGWHDLINMLSYSPTYDRDSFEQTIWNLTLWNSVELLDTNKEIFIENFNIETEKKEEYF